MRRSCYANCLPCYRGPTHRAKISIQREPPLTWPHRPPTSPVVENDDCEIPNLLRGSNDGLQLGVGSIPMISVPYQLLSRHFNHTG